MTFIYWLCEIPILSIAGLIVVGYLISMWGIHRAIRSGRMAVIRKEPEIVNYDLLTGRKKP